MTPLLTLSGVHKAYGRTPVIRGLDLAVTDGEFVGVIGPNGAGKTTAFGLIAGHLRCDSGTIHLQGQDITALSADQRCRAGIGRTFQIPQPFAGLSVYENALVAATHLLIPIQSSYFALEGTDDLLETIEKVRARANPTLRILGVVITMHDKRTALARDIRLQIDKVFGSKVFKTVITKSVRLEESPAYKESIFSFAPESSGAAEYYRLSEEVIDRA